MYYTKVRLTGLVSVDLPHVGASIMDQYVLKSADGLVAPDIDVYISTSAVQGGSYLGRTPQNRELVFKIGLNPDYSSGETASDLRQALYGLLTPGINDYVQIDIMDGNDVVMSTQGQVSKFDNPVSDKDPEVDLTIVCPDFFFAGAQVTVDTSTLDKSTPVIHNNGTAPTGFYMELKFTGSITHWSLTDAAGNLINFVYNFVNNDILKLNTQPGVRNAILTRAGVDYTLLGTITARPKWHVLHGGDNTYTTSSNGFTWNAVNYIPRYWGV